MKELCQKGIELWETAEQIMKHNKISSSEARAQMIFYQKQAVECWQILLGIRNLLRKQKTRCDGSG